VATADQKPPVDLARARTRLEQERARVESLMRDLRVNVADRETEGDAQPTTFDAADTASDTTQRTEDLSILESLEAELVDIDAALGRVADGTYGIDQLTGEPIDPARLDAVPTARTNVTGRDA
jgi:RNA polymerase-binding transcription factor